MSPAIPRGLAVAASLLAVALGPAATLRAQQAEAFKFALIGDLGYSEVEEVQIPVLMGEIDAADLAFVIHDGDFKGGSPREARPGSVNGCTDELFARRLASFEASVHPVVYTPGDNEWTDCHYPPQGEYDPVERLAKLRAMFFPRSESLGQSRMPVTSQAADRQFAAYRENVRWDTGVVTFLTVHVVGSNNNRGRTDAMDAEYAKRNAANLAWLRQGFAHAREVGSRGVMVTIQANPNFDRPPEERTGFNDFIDALREETVSFDGQVVLVHGDTHYFRIDKPLLADRRQIQNFTRLETFGSPEVHWVEVRVDPSDPNLFQFRPMIVRANLAAP